MLITEDGELTGAISGGCLEGDALRKARLVILQQEAMLVTYDTMDDDDAKLGVGLGCNGIIHILIEPITTAANNPIWLIKNIIAQNLPAVLVTLFSVTDKKAFQPGTCMVVREDEVIKDEYCALPCAEMSIKDAVNAFSAGKSTTGTYKDTVAYTAFMEYLKPAIALVVVGAGNDAIPLTKIASVLGWDITVIDGRPNYATAARFTAEIKVLTARPNEILPRINITAQTAFVLMTHNYNYEFELLQHILPLNMAYVGMLGPKKKLERMLGELADNGTKLNDQQLDHLYGPVGLDIGSEGAEEIALSIIAEIKAVFSSRNGKSLKYKAVPIHAIEFASTDI